MKYEELELMLMRAIPLGEDRAVHMRELAKLWNVSCDVVKKRIRRGRKEGLQIMSSSAGYWFATCDAERERFVNLMRKQAISRLQSIKHTKKRLKENDGQIKLNVRVDDESEEENPK